MYALPRSPALHASPILNSYFEQALTTASRRVVSSPSAHPAFTITSPRNTTSAIFKSSNRPGTPCYTPPVGKESYFPTLAPVQDSVTGVTPTNSPATRSSPRFGVGFNLPNNTKGSSSLRQSLKREATPYPTPGIVAESESASFGLGFGGLCIETPAEQAEVTSQTTRPAMRRASFAQGILEKPRLPLRLPNMPASVRFLPRQPSFLCESKSMDRLPSNESVLSGISDMTVVPSGQDKHVKWEVGTKVSSDIITPFMRGSNRKGTPHPGTKTGWIEDDEVDTLAGQV